MKIIRTDTIDVKSFAYLLLVLLREYFHEILALIALPLLICLSCQMQDHVFRAHQQANRHPKDVLVVVDIPGLRVLFVQHVNFVRRQHNTAFFAEHKHEPDVDLHRQAYSRYMRVR